MHGEVSVVAPQIKIRLLSFAFGLAGGSARYSNTPHCHGKPRCVNIQFAINHTWRQSIGDSSQDEAGKCERQQTGVRTNVVKFLALHSFVEKQDSHEHRVNLHKS